MQNQIDLLQLWGRSYAQPFLSFVWHSIIASIVIGTIVGSFTLLFLLLVTYSFGWNTNTTMTATNTTTTNTTSTNTTTTNQQLESTNDSLCLLTIIGGMMIGIIHFIHIIIMKKQDPLIGTTIPNMFHRLSTHFMTPTTTTATSHHPISDIMAALSSFLVIMVGAPIGPEVPIIIISCCIPKLLVFLLFGSRPCPRNVDNHHHEDHHHEDHHQFRYQRQRIEALWIQVALASAITSIVYILTYLVTKGHCGCICTWNSPIVLVGIVCVHEISIIGRPNSFTIDSHIQLQHHRYRERQRRQRQQHRRRLGNNLHHTHNDDDHDHDNNGGLFDPHTTSDTLAATTTTQYGLEPRTIVVASTTTALSPPPTGSSSSDQSHLMLRLNDHDYMEVLTVQLIGSMVAIGAIRFFLDILHPAMNNNNAMPMNNKVECHNMHHTNMNRTEYDDYIGTRAGWDVLIAIPVGILCGVVTSSVMGLICIFHSIRRMIYHQSKQRWMTNYMFVLVWPTITLLLLEVVVRITTMKYRNTATGIGISILQDTYEIIYQQQQQDDVAVPLVFQNVTSLGTYMKFINDASSFTSTSDVTYGIMLVFSRGLCVAISLGFGGFIGGIMYPLFIIGIGVGIIIGSIFPIPFTLSIPCCMVGCTVSVCPVPITMVLSTIIIMLSCSFTVTGPLLVVALSAWFVTGGLGIIRSMETKRINMLIYQQQQQQPSSSISQFDIPIDDMHRGLLTNDHYYHRPSHDHVSEDEYLRDIRSTIFGSS
jgi:hypothetical protein